MRSLDKNGPATPFKSTQACMFLALLHWGISQWRTWAEGCSFGFGLGDGLPPLLECTFAHDIRKVFPKDLK